MRLLEPEVITVSTTVRNPAVKEASMKLIHQQINRLSALLLVLLLFTPALAQEVVEAQDFDIDANADRSYVDGSLGDYGCSRTPRHTTWGVVVL